MVLELTPDVPLAGCVSPNLEHVRVWSPGLATGDLGHNGLEVILRRAWGLWDTHCASASSCHGCLKGTEKFDREGRWLWAAPAVPRGWRNSTRISLWLQVQRLFKPVWKDLKNDGAQQPSSWKEGRTSSWLAAGVKFLQQRKL